LSEILARLIERAVGPSFDFGEYRVTRSTTHIDDIEIFRFRFSTYLEAGFILPQAFPDGILRDEFDSAATQIAVRDVSGLLVGTTRFVRPSRLGFHTERLFDLELPPINRNQMGEFGRLAIKANNRGGDRFVMLAMLKAVFECMIEVGTTHVLAFLSPKLADSFARLGCKPLTLRAHEPGHRALQNRGAMKGYFDSQRPIPVLYDLEQMLSDVGVRRKGIASRLQSGSTEHALMPTT
jgi:N-acyl-L-homoserine lactone synthetase